MPNVIPKIMLLESLLGFNHKNKSLLMSLPLKYKGLYIPDAKRKVGGTKIKQDFLLDYNKPEDIAVTVEYTDILKDGLPFKIQKKVTYYNTDDTIYCSKIEEELVKKPYDLINSRSKAAYNYLFATAKGTLLENVVFGILEHYAKEVGLWLIGDKSALLNAIDNETDTTILAHLAIDPNQTGKTIKDAIIEQVTGVSF